MTGGKKPDYSFVATHKTELDEEGRRKRIFWGGAWINEYGINISLDAGYKIVDKNGVALTTGREGEYYLALWDKKLGKPAMKPRQANEDEERDAERFMGDDIPF